MQDYTLGYRWAGHAAVAPRVTDVVEVCGAYPRRIASGRHPTWVLDYEFVSHGVGRVKSPRASWRPRLPHTAHLYPPGLPYWEDTRTERGRRHSAWICFVGGEAVGLDALLHPRKGYARFLDTQGRLGALLRDAAVIGRREGAAGFWRAQAVLAHVFHLLLRARQEGEETYRLPGRTEEEDPPLARTVDRYLRARLGERITLADLARHAGVSVSTLSHEYRRLAGRSPMAHLRDLRMDHAKALLLKGLPLKAIAPQLGFTDAFHLSKAFKRVEGISPRAFRERPAWDAPPCAGRGGTLSTRAGLGPNV